MPPARKRNWAQQAERPPSRRAEGGRGLDESGSCNFPGKDKSPAQVPARARASLVLSGRCLEG
eukprot:2267116-Alexandrium_andersonii.AAC.1